MTKQDVLDIEIAKKALQPYQDEKLGLLHRENDDMSNAFVEAREGRGVLAQLYDQRNKEILDRLESMRKKIDKGAKKQLDRLKAFDHEMEQNTASRKKSWKQKFLKDKHDITTRQSGVSDTILELDAAIVKEHEDCLVLAAESTEPLLNALEKHRRFLAEQEKARAIENERFAEDMAHRFQLLRARISEEAEARSRNGVEIHEKANQRIRALEKRATAHIPEVQKKLDACRQRLETELKLHSSAQEGVVADMMRFMHDFEESILVAGKQQEQTKAHLMKLQEMLRSAED